jgi:hypothetical protein
MPVYVKLRIGGKERYLRKLFRETAMVVLVNGGEIVFKDEEYVTEHQGRRGLSSLQRL